MHFCFVRIYFVILMALYPVDFWIIRKPFQCMLCAGLRERPIPSQVPCWLSYAVRYLSIALVSSHCMTISIITNLTAARNAHISHISGLNGSGSWPDGWPKHVMNMYASSSSANTKPRSDPLNWMAPSSVSMRAINSLAIWVVQIDSEWYSMYVWNSMCV